LISSAPVIVLRLIDHEMRFARRKPVKVGLFALATLIAVASTEASAQAPNLSGQYQCVQGCAEAFLGLPAFVTQDGWDLNIANEAGARSRAWIDRPGHIWVRSWDEGAVYSPDGMTIQFENGTIWQRAVVLVPAVPVPGIMPPPPNRRVPPPPPTARPSLPPQRTAVDVFDGSWSVTIITQSGGCGPEYRYGVQIINGVISTDTNDSASVRGRVSPNGAVSVGVSSGGSQAVGQGRLSQTSGSGTWRGESSGQSCTGVWQAARHG
jgi:hypothetical protein